MADNDNHVVTPDHADLAVARRVVNSPAVIGQFAACEWDELGEDGKAWVAAIVREAVRDSRSGARSA